MRKLVTEWPPKADISDFSHSFFDTWQVISNHKTGNGFWFRGLSVGKCIVNFTDFSAANNRNTGNIHWTASPVTTEIGNWFTETMGEEWDRWHIKIFSPMSYNPSNWSHRIIIKPGHEEHAEEIRTEIYVREPVDYSLFKLRWM